MQPTLDLHPEVNQIFHFAENTTSNGCCCWWRSKPVYTVTKDDKLAVSPRMTFQQRIVAEHRLARLVETQLEDDPVENDKAFKRLKEKIGDNLTQGKPITEERILKIVNAIYELRREFERQEKEDSY
jgi:hypothetical protein